MIRALALSLLLLLTGAALAPPTPAARAEGVEADLATHHVAVKTDFAGVNVLLFGAIVNQGDIDNLALLDMIIVVRGPEREMRVRKKERIAGLWVNRESATFDSVPGYYATLSTRPVSEIAPSYTLLQNGIGFTSLQGKLILSSTGFTQGNAKDYAAAVVRVHQSQNLYQELKGAIDFTGQHLFRAEFELPANVPLGDYTADVYTFRGGKLIGNYTTNLKIEKSGVERFIYELAHQQPLIYGIISVILALAAGMGAAALFRKA
ncbi:MAG: TIGR02186 family protein [Pseudomonadota bacterium]